MKKFALLALLGAAAAGAAAVCVKVINCLLYTSDAADE